MSQLVSVASGYGATQYDTKIPSLGDAANVVEAFKLYHYGIDNYDGSVPPAASSIESHLVNLKSIIDQKLSISSASSTYATFAYAVGAASSASAHVFRVSASAAVGLIESAQLISETTTRTSAYTLTLADQGKLVPINVSASTTLTVPTNASVAFTTLSKIDILQAGAGKIKIVPAGGVTINFFDNGDTTSGQWAIASLIKRGTNTWLAVGNLST